MELDLMARLLISAIRVETSLTNSAFLLAQPTDKISQSCLLDVKLLASTVRFGGTADIPSEVISYSDSKHSHEDRLCDSEAYLEDE